MAKVGRPSVYTDEIAERILDELAAGESLVRICAAEDMPGLRTVMRWTVDKEDFGAEYARAREAQAEVMDDKILRAADEASSDPQAARVKVDAYKWRAAKLAPKRYGDATTVKHADADGEKLELDDTSKLTRLAALASSLSKRADDPDNAE